MVTSDLTGITIAYENPTQNGDRTNAGFHMLPVMQERRQTTVAHHVRTSVSCIECDATRKATLKASLV